MDSKTTMTLDEVLAVLRQYIDNMQEKIDNITETETEVIHDWEQWQFAANQLRSEFIEEYYIKGNQPNEPMLESEG